MTQVSLSTSTNFDGDINALIEEQGTELTVRFDLDEAAPTGGLRVFIDSNIEQIVNRLDLPGFAFNPVTENINPFSFTTDFDNSGFALTINEGATFGAFTITVFDNTEPDTFLPETFDGLVEATFSLKTQDEVGAEDALNITDISEYTINSDSATSVVFFADDASQLPTINPDEPVVTFTTDTTTLVESDGGFVTLQFEVEGEIPEDGLPISLSINTTDASQLFFPDFQAGDFEFESNTPNVFDEGNFWEFKGADDGTDTGLAIVKDDDIFAVVEPPYDTINLVLTANTASIRMPILDDVITEADEIVTFELQDGDGYGVVTDNAPIEVTLTDGDSSVIDAPTVSLATSATEFEEGQELTFIINLSEAPTNPEGLRLRIASDTVASIGEFAVSRPRVDTDGDGIGDTRLVEGATLTGIADPFSLQPNEDGSGFFVNVTEQTATITVTVRQDDIPEGVETFTYSILEGEDYNVDTENGSATFTINDIEPPPPALPVVSFETVPTTLSEEAENNLVEWKWTVEGDFPEEGIVVNFDTLGENDVILFTEQFAASPEAEFIDADIVGFDEVTGRLNILLSAPEASFKLFIINDIIEEGTQPFDFQLAPGDNYLVDPNKNSTLFTITDDNGGVGVGPLVGISTTTTELIEGDEFTFNFTVDGEIPESGVEILVGSSVIGSLGQFDVADLSKLVLKGIEGLPSVGDSTGSSFLVTLTEPTASITTSIFNDTVEDEPLEVSFNIVNGEEYEVNPNAESITLNISDEPQPVGPTVGLTINQSDVVEGDIVTFTFTVDGDIPDEGIQVFVNDNFSAQNQLRSLTELDVNNVEFTGISEFPIAAEADSGFFVTITEPTATITVPILDEGVDEDEANESFTFELIDGEAYEVNPDANSITLNITDAVDAGKLPTISIDTVAGTYDGDNNVITSNLVESIDGGTPILSVNISSDVSVPESGVIVNVNTDLADITELVAEPAFAPFIFGGEFLGAIYNSEGVATGFQVRLDNRNATINFLDVGFAAEGVQDFNFSVESGAGYIVSDSNSSSAVTVYDSIDQVPTPPAPPVIGLTIDNTSLVEGESATTFNFDVDGEIPPEGVIVSVSSGVRFAIGEFDAFRSIVEGGSFPIVNQNASGFYFKITEPTASITLFPVEDELNPETVANSAEGIESFTFALQEQAGYIIDSDAAVVSFTIADDADSKLQVSLSSEPEILIEESGTNAVFTLNLSTAPPAEGVVVTLNSDSLSDLTTIGLEVTGGGIVSINSDGTVSILVTEQTATVSLPVNNDGIAEGLETAVFNLVEPAADAAYQINPNANTSSFDIYDTLNEAPVIVQDAESNDTISTSIPLEINGERSKALVQGAINFNFRNNRDVDQTEDVDMYSVELQSSDLAEGEALRDRITIDLDSIPFTNSDGFVLRGGGDLRIFDAAGTELVYNAEGSAPGELFTSNRDAYIDFTAETAGTYYIGVSQAFNENYDPFLKGTGDGALIAPRFGIGAGDYELEIDINPDAPTFEQYVEFDGQSPDAPVVSFVAVPGTFEGNDLVSDQIVESLGVGRGKAALLNFSFQIDGDIPEAGLEVILKSDTDFTQFLEDLNDTPRTARGAELIGAVYNSDGTPAGFKILLTDDNAFLPYTVGERETDDPDSPETIEFSLANSPDYSADTEFNTSDITFYDTLEQIPATGAIPEVSLTIDQTELIETEATETNFIFNIDGTIPDDGLLVYVDSETRASLGEFNISELEVTGGAVPAGNSDVSGFYFRIFENTASITLNALDESINPLIPAEDALEGIEEFTYSLIPSNGYTINPDASEFTLTIADNPDSVVIPEEPDLPDIEVPTDNDGRNTNNDTIADAVPLGLNLANDNLSVTIDGEISERFRGTGNTADATEDVDMYSFDLQQGQTITIDIDANGTGDAGLDSILDSILRIFDAAGNELVINNQGAAPDEIFQAEGDPYLAFTAPETATYYAGISALGNDFYDPNVANSGSGWTFGERFGADIYRVNFSLGSMFTSGEEIFGTPEDDTLMGTDGADVITGNSGNDTINGGAEDDILRGQGGKDVLNGNAGNDTLIGGNGRDIFVVGEGLDIIKDFEIGKDKISLLEADLTFDDLSIIPRESGTLLRVTDTGAKLAVIRNITTDDLAEDNFITSDNPVSTPIFGTAGEDTIEVTGTNQIIFAGNGDDFIDLSGSDGGNRILGDGGDDTVILTSGDTILGGIGSDRFFATSGGDNIITGEAGADQFWIASAEIPDAANTITDFTSGEDVIGIAGLGIGFEDLSITATEGDALVSIAGSDLAILQGVEAASLTADDFAFA